MRKSFIFSHPGLQFADNALASNDGVSFYFFQSHGQILHLDLQRFLDCLDLDNALLFLMHDLNGVLEFVLHSLVSLITNSQLFGDFLVISSQGGQFLLDFSLR